MANSDWCSLLFVAFGILLIWAIGGASLDLVVVSISSIAAVTVTAKRGKFQPISVFVIFSAAVGLMGGVWIWLNRGQNVSFFGYLLNANERVIDLYHLEYMGFLAAILLGVFFCNSLIGHRSFYSRPSSVSNLAYAKFLCYWWIFYLVGVFALLYLIYRTHGLSADTIIDNLAAKGERAAGAGGFVILSFSSYLGAFLWFVKNVWRGAVYRYCTLLFLLSPMLLSGSRTGFIVVLIAAANIDERTGRTVSWRTIALWATPLVVFFVFYQWLRVGIVQGAFFESLFKDLSMNVGFLVALDIDLFGQAAHPEVMLLSFVPFLPDVLAAYAGASPNRVLTDSMFSFYPNSTFSMGVIGEGYYAFGAVGRFVFYFAVGFLFTLISLWRGKYAVAITALLAGVSVRFVKGGLTQGFSNAMMLIVPLILAIVLWQLVPKSRDSRR